MRPVPAYSVEEIGERHGARVFSGRSSIDAAFTSARASYEIVEAYVRPDGEGTVFEPLEERHLLTGGEWALALAPRCDQPRIIGIMLAKDEADAIPEVIANLSGAIDALYYFAGDEATARAIVASAPNPGWARAVPVGDVPHADGLRQILLEAVRADADGRPTWVMVVQGDEVYHDDLRKHVLVAHAERATVMTCQVATFLLHESQREGWDWSLPLEQRLTHYIWDFGEHAGFLDFPWVHYVPTEHMRAHPHGLFGKWAEARPVRKHYPFRSPEQAAARIEDRLRRHKHRPLGWQPHYESYRQIFMDAQAAGREVKHYHGWFPEAERPRGAF